MNPLQPGPSVDICKEYISTANHSVTNGAKGNSSWRYRMHRPQEGERPEVTNSLSGGLSSSQIRLITFCYAHALRTFCRSWGENLVSIGLLRAIKSEVFAFLPDFVQEEAIAGMLYKTRQMRMCWLNARSVRCEPSRRVISTIEFNTAGGVSFTECNTPHYFSQ